MPPTSEVQFDLYFSDALGDIDLKLVNAANVVLDTSNSTSNDESASWINHGTTTA